MERTTLILVLVLALSGCMSTQQIDNQTQEIVRPAITATVQVGTIEDTGEKVGAILTVSDYEKMARTSMQEGQTLRMPTTPPATITMEVVEEQYIIITLNNQTREIQEGETAFFEDGALQLYLARTIS